MDSCPLFPLVAKHCHYSPFFLVALELALACQFRVIQAGSPCEEAQESPFSLCLALLALYSTVFQRGNHDPSTCIPVLNEPQRIER